MSLSYTAAGRAYYVALRDGTTPAFNYGNLIFGTGLTGPTANDTVASVTERLPLQVAGVRTKDDDDIRNPGRGPEVYTFRFEVSATDEPKVISNLALAASPLVSSNPLAVHAKQFAQIDPYRMLIVWVNLAASSARVDTLNVPDPIASARYRGTGARLDVLYGGFGSQVLEPGHVYSKVRAGEGVPLRGAIYGEDGNALRSADVKYVDRVVSTYSAKTNSWVDGAKRRLNSCVFPFRRESALFPYQGGFNLDLCYSGRETRDGQDCRITYRLGLCDGNERTLRQTVTVLPS